MSETHVAVWRAEQVGMYGFIYFLGICQRVGVGGFESTDVVESVVADAVPVFSQHPVLVRVFLYIVAYHEEGSFTIVFFQQFQYPGSNFGDRSVIKSQVDGPFVRVHSENGLRIQRPEKPRWLFYKHESLYFFEIISNK